MQQYIRNIIVTLRRRTDDRHSEWSYEHLGSI